MTPRDKGPEIILRGKAAINQASALIETSKRIDEGKNPQINKVEPYQQSKITEDTERKLGRTASIGLLTIIDRVIRELIPADEDTYAWSIEMESRYGRYVRTEPVRDAKLLRT